MNLEGKNILVGYTPLSNSYYFYIEEENSTDVPTKKILDIRHDKSFIERAVLCMNFLSGMSNAELKTNGKNIPDNKKQKHPVLSKWRKNGS